jgi:uncharacterized membrane protein
MSSSERRVDTPALRETLERAVGLGLISHEQAAAILALEVPGAVMPAAQGMRVRPVVAEALGYIGAVLTLVSAVIITSQFWADLRPGARVGLLAVATAALLAAGTPLEGGGRAAARLGSFLWALSAAGFAFCVTLVGHELLSLPADRTAALAAWSTTLFSGVLWLRRPRTLQQTACFIGVVSGAVATLMLIERSLASWAGLAVWALGLAWLLLAWGEVVRPAGVGYTLGSLAALAGPVGTRLGAGRWELLIGLVTAGALVVASILVRRTLLLGLGVVGLFFYIPAAVFAFFGDTLGAPVALFVAGVGLVAISLLLPRLGARARGAMEEAGHA